jgi:hypothetical protein
MRAAQAKAPERRLRDEPKRRETRVIDKPSRPTAARKAARVAIPVKTFGRPARRERKNPLSVFVTMLMVGGLFAVAGLPAYATVEQEVAAPNDRLATQKLDAQSLLVSPSVASAALERDTYSATSPEDLAQMARDALRAAQRRPVAMAGSGSTRGSRRDGP